MLFFLEIFSTIRIILVPSITWSLTIVIFMIPRRQTFIIERCHMLVLFHLLLLSIPFITIILIHLIIFDLIMNITTIIVIFVLALLVHAEQKNCKRLNFLPMPRNLTCGDAKVDLPDPCKIFFHARLKEGSNSHVEELIAFQMRKTLSCHIPNVLIAPELGMSVEGFAYKVQISIDDAELKSAFKTEEEQYQLSITTTSAKIRSITYVGFVRALETFMQSIRCSKFKTKDCAIQALPLVIKDEPFMKHRALMIDSARHFLPLRLVYETIDAMMYNKMNVLHWHLVDQDSFPVILDSHPEIAQYAAFSPEETYTTKELRQVVDYGLRRGVRITPELDTPGHAASWGLSPQNSGVACTFGTGFMGPLDVTLDKTYKLVEEVFAEIFDIFPDPQVHLGGDEVVLTCLANKTVFMAKEQVKQHEIQRHYRRKQHKILKNLNPNKKMVYWMNSQDIQIQDGDIVHWWGGGLPNTKNQVIISQYGPFYIDMGVGNYLGVSYGSYATWMDIYNLDIGRMIENYSNKKNVIGAELTLWSELSNQYIHHMKIWIRASSLAERTWTPEEFTVKPDVLGRIAAQEQLMNRRGIPTAGATSQQCETHPEFC